MTAAPDDPVQAGEQLLETMVEQAGLEQAERRVIAGFAAEGLADLADEQAAELIVVGTHGRTGLAHAMLGSVAERVVRRAACPVLTVPFSKKAA